MTKYTVAGLINNVLYVIILSAALDLVGPNVPKGIVLLADVLPSFVTKLIAPYFIHKIPYGVRILTFVALSSSGMFLIALTPSTQDGGSVGVKLVGVIIGSLSSGGGELSFLGLTHYYGHFSLAAWGSGTGGAGLVGAGFYIVLTGWMRLSIKSSLLASAFLPLIMLASFFFILPHEPLMHAERYMDYLDLPSSDAVGGTDETPPPSPSANHIHSTSEVDSSFGCRRTSLMANLRRAGLLFFPYMLPLFIVYIAEYTINLGVSPTLLFALSFSPFSEFRAFYPFYNFLYQIGVFIARTSSPFMRMHALYIPSLLQVANLLTLTSHAMYDWIPNVYIVFIIIFWEGLLGGFVYINTFAEIMDTVPKQEREFSLGATSVSDSGGICIAGFLSMALEVFLCNWQVEKGRNWCKQL
jgi:battenin